VSTIDSEQTDFNANNQPQNMSECVSTTDPCTLSADYSKFDQRLAREMSLTMTASGLVNSSAFCVAIPLDQAEFDILNPDDHLASLRKKVGLYHLWVDGEEVCQIHDQHKMICVYVGKGVAFTRIKLHIKEKWPAAETIYITFTECENRIAKYLEQLFLDTYEFYLNENENSGSGYLYGLWDGHRYDNGTETQRLGDILLTRL
jgi:hypothetical protein